MSEYDVLEYLEMPEIESEAITSDSDSDLSFFDTPFDEYSTTDSLLLLIAFLLFIGFIYRIIREVF